MAPDVLIFDLDNTVYPREKDLFSLLDRRINLYMSDVVGIPPGEVDALRRRYWADYGVTLGGLIRHHGVNPEDYLDFVHDVDISVRLSADPELGESLASCPQRKVIFTNAPACHASRVLSCLGVESHFEHIFDIRVASYLPKPFPEPYLHVLEKLAADPERCVMVEDSLENLETAKKLGMGTIWIGAGEVPPYVDVRVSRAAEVAGCLGFS